MGKSRKKEKQIKTYRQKRYWAMAVVMVMAIAILGISVWAAVCYFPATVPAGITIQPDEHAKSGTLHAGEPEEVAEGDFWLVMNQLPTMEEGSLDCNIEYENPLSNHYSARISLYGREDGKMLGSTGRVDPGTYVETIRLEKEQKPGEYPVTVRLELFEQMTPVSEMSIDITLRVISRNQ